LEFAPLREPELNEFDPAREPELNELERAALFENERFCPDEKWLGELE
jgi:hypothetical protein